MPVLQEFRVVTPLAPGKAGGLADYGAPLTDTTVVKKGRVHEFAQRLPEGAIGRRFQDLRVVGIKTVEGAVTSARLFLQFEVFGDNTAVSAGGAGFEIVLSAGTQPLTHLSAGSLYLPYGNFWYPNRYAFEVSTADFDRADGLEFVARPDEVRSLG